MTYLQVFTNIYHFYIGIRYVANILDSELSNEYYTVGITVLVFDFTKM